MTLRLLLLRHAKSDWSVPGQSDRDRALSPRGERAAPGVGEYLAQQSLIPDLVLCSPARRTRETWELVRAALGANPPVRVEPRIYEAAISDLMAVIHAADPAALTLLLVGHNPGFQELASLLTAGRGKARTRLLEKFPTAALAWIEFEAANWNHVREGEGDLRAFVTPRDGD